MTHFLLTTDKAATRRLRRLVATQHPGLSVIVGTWPELLSLATKNYLLPPGRITGNRCLKHLLLPCRTPSGLPALLQHRQKPHQ
jgi:hypothetical protein